MAEPAGGIQLIRPNPASPLPCLRVWPELEAEIADRADVAHVAVLAVAKRWRGSDATGTKAGSCFWELVAALWRHCVESGIRELWLEATPPVLRGYRLLGWPLQVRGPLREHWGEPCYPCSLSVREVAGALAERAVRLRSRTYRRILADALLPVSDEC